MKNILATLLFYTYVTFTFSEPRVSIGITKIVGTFMKTIGNRTVSAFRGIPYAEPPIGNLRFKNTCSLNDLWFQGCHYYTFETYFIFCFSLLQRMMILILIFKLDSGILYPKHL